MEKTYTMQDVATMTGLTTRTLRTYQQQGFLRGGKENGTWHFTEEDLERFLQNPAVLPAIQARQHAIVYDFILQNRKTRDELCAALDFSADAEQARPSQTFSAPGWSRVRTCASPSSAQGSKFG